MDHASVSLFCMAKIYNMMAYRACIINMIILQLIVLVSALSLWCVSLLAAVAVLKVITELTVKWVGSYVYMHRLMYRH